MTAFSATCRSQAERESDISVIIPVYNTAKYLPQCLDSVSAQSLAPLEIICVDDCSSDASREFLARRQETQPNLRIVDFPTRRGPGAARNAALELARGRYVAFLDSDDWWAPSYCLELRNLAEKTGADFVCCAASVYNDKTGRVCRRHQPRSLKNFSSAQAGLALRPGQVRDCFHKVPTEAWGKLFRKSFLDDNGLRFVADSKFEDVFFHCDIFAAMSTFAVLKKFLMFYRDQRSGSVMNASHGDCSDMIPVRAYLFDKLSAHGLLDKMAARFWGDTFGAFDDLLANAYDEYRETFYRLMLDFFKTRRPSRDLLAADALVRENFVLFQAPTYAEHDAAKNSQRGRWGCLWRKSVRAHKLEYKILNLSVVKIKSGGRNYFLGIRYK
ncbi:MAG: glycosyltransferase [Candidatus Adiutrix sp.]|nr:glycosyltransferase [Candidatus Adiutrix sp.]